MSHRRMPGSLARTITSRSRPPETIPHSVLCVEQKWRIQRGKLVGHDLRADARPVRRARRHQSKAEFPCTPLSIKSVRFTKIYCTNSETKTRWMPWDSKRGNPYCRCRDDCVRPGMPDRDSKPSRSASRAASSSCLRIASGIAESSKKTFREAARTPSRSAVWVKSHLQVEASVRLSTKNDPLRRKSGISWLNSFGICCRSRTLMIVRPLHAAPFPAFVQRRIHLLGVNSAQFHSVFAVSLSDCIWRSSVASSSPRGGKPLPLPPRTMMALRPRRKQ